MVFESLFSSFLSVGGIISLVVNVIVTMLAIIIANNIIAHEMEVKHALIMALACYLVLPMILGLALPYLSFLAGFSFLILLLAWIVMGELLLKSDMKQKAIVAVIAYAINLFLMIYVSGFIFSFLPF